MYRGFTNPTRFVARALRAAGFLPVKRAGAYLAKMPQDGLQVGHDAKGAVGDYEAPFAFDGEIGLVTVVVEP